MRRQPAFFGDRELNLIYIAKRLPDALRLENALTEAGVDYAVEMDTYRGGIIFVTERVGAFFYVDDAALDSAQDAMRRSGFQPWQPS
jgi:hypothetical protein